MRIRNLLPLVLLGCASSSPPAAAPHEPTAVEELSWVFLRGDLERAGRVADRLEARGERTGALSLRVAIAEVTHDRDGLTRLLEHADIARLRENIEERALLANAVASTIGVTAARADLDAVCASPALPKTSKTRTDACSLAAVAAAANGRTPAFSGEESVELDLLPKVPIPIVLLSLNGLPPAPFILDTGAAGIALSKSYCDEHGIKYLTDAPRVTRDASGGDVPLFPVFIDSLDAKGMRISALDGIVIQLPPSLRVGGIIGPHRAFAGALVEIDLRAKKLRLRQGADGSTDAWVSSVSEPVRRAPLIWDDGNVFVRARIDERLGGFMNFDTGAVGSIVSLDTVTKLGRTVDRAKASESVSIHKHASFPPFEGTLALGDGATAERETFAPIERKEGDHARLAPIGNVGMSWMKNRRIAISADGRTLLYTAASPSEHASR